MPKKNKKTSKKCSPRLSEEPKPEKKRGKNKKDKKKNKERRDKALKTSDSGNENEKQDERREKKVASLPKRHIPINSSIDTTSSTYLVVKKLGAGGFGDVYEALRLSDKKVCAVKVEYVKKGDDRRLKKEYEIYREITKAKMRNKPNAKHLMEVIDYGEVAGLVHFMFMPLCGQSLDSLIKKKKPTLGAAISLTDQTLRAIQNFHSFKHIHRDIKPANFVLGRHPFHNQVFLIDFGMAVRYCVDEEKMPKASIYDFIGTVRYASRTTHKGSVQTRKDDLESWMYVSMEFFDIDVLPWAGTKDQKIVQQMKEILFEEQTSNVFSRLPSCFSLIAATINAIKPFEEPKYDIIHGILLKLAKKNGVALDGPLKISSNEPITPTSKSHTPSADSTPAGSMPASPLLNFPVPISPFKNYLQGKPRRARSRNTSTSTVDDELLAEKTQNNTVDATTLEESDSSSSIQAKVGANNLHAKSAYVSPPPPQKNP